MGVLGTLGIVVGLVVIAVMAIGPALVDLNERFPPREHDDAAAEPGRSLDLRLARHGRPALSRDF